MKRSGMEEQGAQPSGADNRARPGSGTTKQKQKNMSTNKDNKNSQHSLHSENGAQVTEANKQHAQKSIDYLKTVIELKTNMIQLLQHEIEYQKKNIEVIKKGLQH